MIQKKERIISRIGSDKSKRFIEYLKLVEPLKVEIDNNL